MNVAKTVELTQAVAVIVDVPKTYLVVKGLRPWTGIYIAGKLPDGQTDPDRSFGVVHNGNFTEAMVRVLEEQGYAFTESDVPPPVGLNLIGEGIVNHGAPEMLADDWEEATSKVPGGPPGFTAEPKTATPVAVVVPVVAVKTKP